MNFSEVEAICSNTYNFDQIFKVILGNFSREKIGVQRRLKIRGARKQHSMFPIIDILDWRKEKRVSHLEHWTLESIFES